mmetsp:Transcript_27583/g.58927  ORF Transcript_27583/g.58927 Transcript_27583/m.58927 type:complete len:206 (+) Transcript_27583:304-921(+)
MFHPSAATDTLQGRAIQKINEVWGEDKHRGWDNYKSLGMPVCKKKYRPFEFKIKKKNKLGGVDISVVRMYGCCAHSNMRKKVIEQHGERKGWEPFGQWSLSKAKALARRETRRLNAELNHSTSCFSDTSSSSSSGYESARSSSSEEENASLCLIEDTRQLLMKDTKQQRPWHALCANGTCNWKIRGKIDDICSEIEEERLERVEE